MIWTICGSTWLAMGFLARAHYISVSGNDQEHPYFSPYTNIIVYIFLVPPLMFWGVGKAYGFKPRHGWRFRKLSETERWENFKKTVSKDFVSYMYPNGIEDFLREHPQ